MSSVLTELPLKLRGILGLEVSEPRSHGSHTLFCCGNTFGRPLAAAPHFHLHWEGLQPSMSGIDNDLWRNTKKGNGAGMKDTCNQKYEGPCHVEDSDEVDLGQRKWGKPRSRCPS